MKPALIFKNILYVDESLRQEVRIWRNKEFVRENMYNRHEITNEEHNRFLKSLQNSNKKLFFISFLDENPIGIISYDIYNENEFIEFAYYLKDKENVSKGYGAIFEYKFLNYFFFNLKIKKVKCEVLVKNKKTISLHKKFGFVVKEIITDISKSDEKICQLEINKEQWIESKTRIEKLVNRILNLNEIGEINI